MLSLVNAIPHSGIDYRLVGLNNSAAVVIVLERRLPVFEWGRNLLMRFHYIPAQYACNQPRQLFSLSIWHSRPS